MNSAVHASLSRKWVSASRLLVTLDQCLILCIQKQDLARNLILLPSFQNLLELWKRLPATSDVDSECHTLMGGRFLKRQIDKWLH